MKETRPRLVLSRCLELDACRYNGATIRAPLVTALAEHVELVPVCPEIEVGLGVPRDPIRLVRPDGGGTRLVQPSTGRDLTGAMRGFGSAFLDGLSDVDGFLLKSRSPSCGIDGAKVYAGAGDALPVDEEAGMFAAAVLERFRHHPVEHERHLADPEIRDHWLTALFAGAALRLARARGGMAALVAFHARHKLTLMASAPADQKALGRVVANAEGRAPDDVWEAYAPAFRRALATRPGRGRHVNALQHAAGYFKDTLGSAEKRRFGELLEEYRAGRASRLAPLELVRSWARRHGEPWLSGQTYLAPYPPGLMDPRDADA